MILGAMGLNFRELTLPRKNFLLKTDKIEFVLARRKHILGFSTLQFAFQCHDIVEVNKYCQMSGVVCFLFI